MICYALELSLVWSVVAVAYVFKFRLHVCWIKDGVLLLFRELDEQSGFSCTFLLGLYDLFGRLECIADLSAIENLCIELLSKLY